MMLYYCTGCRNDPRYPCCHMHEQERVPLMECRCVALKIPQRDTEEPKGPAGG